LGGLDVDGLASHEVGSRKGRALLAVLAVARGRAVATDRLVDVLWPEPERLPTRPADQVGVLVSRLRNVLGAERLPRVGRGYALICDWLDVVELEARVAEAAARAQGSPGAARAAAAAALSLVRGRLLPDEEGEWVEAERATVDRLIAQAHFLGAEAALAGGEAMVAAGEAAKVLDADPYDEAALRLLMRAHVAAGRPGSALGAYARVRAQLAEDLGTSPDPTTEEVHDAILRGELDKVGVAATSPSPASLVGRDPELRWLDGHLAAVDDGASRLVVVEGQAGIGKTALVRSWEAAQGSAFVLDAACDELGRDLPLQPVLDGLEAHLTGLADDELAAVLGPQREIVGPLLNPSLLNPSLVGPSPLDPSPSDPSLPARAGHTQLPDPAAARAALFAALLAIVERAAAGRPVVVVVDDAHLAGGVTLAWLGYAVRRGRRLLVVATRRPGERAEATQIPADDVRRLGPLGLDAAAQLVGADRADDLHQRSGGHPLFLVALGNAASALPATITEAVEQQLDRLGQAAAVTLRSAAVLGPDVDVALLADSLGRRPADLLDDVEAAARAGLVVDGADGFAFAHGLVREAMVDATSAARRALLHREAARALAQRSGAEVEPLRIAHHARLGGDTDLAAHALARAAQQAGSRADHDGAVRLLDEAVGLADGAESRLARARARLAVRDLDGAKDDVDLAIAAGAGVAGLELAGWISYYRRDFAAALRYAEEGAARSGDPALRGSCLLLAGRVVHSSGDLAGAEQRLADAATIAPASLRPLVAIWLGDLRVFQGRWREAGDQADRALLDRTQLTHPFALPHALITRLRAAAIGGRVDVALATSAETLAEMERLGELGARYVPGACNYRGWVLRNLGQYGEADDLNERARSLTPGSGMEEPFNHATLDLADGRLLAGDPDGAAGYLAELRGLGRNGSDGSDRSDRSDGSDGSDDETPAMAWHQHERATLIESRLALARGRCDAAARLADELVTAASDRGSLRHAVLARAVALTARSAAGDPPSPDDVHALLAQLDEVAGLDGWRITAELARHLPDQGRDHGVRQGAERRAARLLAATPPEHRPTLERWIRSVYVE
jgi:DNA-binding SARP family transcriptional activator/tetratricopeptide (TPR) repeat protein